MKNTRWHRTLTLLLSVCMLLSLLPMSALAAEDADEYTLYPAPHEITYGSGSYELKNINVLYGTGMDEATKARLTETAQLRNLTVTESTAADTGKTNVYVAIYGAGDAVETYIREHYSVEDTLFVQTDAHFVASSNGEIVVLGRDVDACFYGITTLYQIFGQLESNTLRNFTVKDYADVASRGFIEGYYGNPWSLEDRINLMKWGGYYKLNSYFYAPKDDPKHNSAWRELYTDEEIENLIKPLAEAGNQSKCRFVFALHPYMYNPISYSSEEAYQADLAVLQAKFLQVIKAGVRQIAILADDAGSVGGANYTRTLEDMTAWLEELQGTYPDLKLLLPFVTQEYMYNGESYYADFPENVQIVMTGGKIWGEVSNNFTSTFYNNTGRGPYLWINWPCTDNSKKHLIMGGYTTFLHSGVDPSKIQGIVLNPMQQSEPSKVAIFGNACYSWNIWETDAEANEAYEVSFACVDHNTVVPNAASEALKEMSKHMINQNMDGRVTALQESVELKSALTSFKSKLTAGTYTADDINDLIGEFTTLQTAAKTYRASGNKAIADQIVYWLDCWDDTTTAVISYLKALLAIRENQGNAAVWQYYSAGQEAYTASLDHPLWYVDHYEYAEVGVQHIVPFMKALDSYLADVALEIVYPNGVPGSEGASGSLSMTPFEGNNPSHYSGSLSNVVDGSNETFVWYNGVAQSEQYIGVKLGEVAKLGQITFVQDDGDRFYSYELQYSTDGSSYTTYGTYTDAQLTVDLTSAGIEAQYVRFVSSDSNGKWVKICEISVSRASTTTVLTNREELASHVTKIVSNSGKLVTTGSVTLAPNEYIGLDLGRIKDLNTITVTDPGALTLEVSANQLHWTEVEPGQVEEDARYVRLINKTDADVTTELTEFVVTSHEVQEPTLHSSNIGINNSWGVSEDCRNNGAAFDGNVSTMTEFADFPQEGQYIIYDLGQERNIRKLEIYCADSAVNYIRDAKIQISNDLTNWTDVLTIGDGVENTNDANITCINSDAGYSQTTSSYPNYVSIEGTCDPTAARYLRILITASNNNRAVVFNEIEINEGEYVSVSNDPSFRSNVTEAQGYPPQNMIDGDLTTSYKPGTEEAGYLIYTFSDNLQANRINIAQKTISNAKVSLYREKDGNFAWEEVGTLDQSMVTFACTGSLKVKLEWTAGNPVNITEIVRYTEEEPTTTQVELEAGASQTVTVAGDYTNAALTGLDTKVATVEVKAHTSNAETKLSAALTALTGDGQYLLVHDRVGKPLTNAASGDQLTMTGSTTAYGDNALWRITAVADGYTVQDASGNYLTVGDSTAGVSDSPVTLTLNYVDSASAWEIGLNGQYLNQFGGAVSSQAAGYSVGAASDAGSRWQIYALTDNTVVESTDIVITGVSKGTTSVTIGLTTYQITVDCQHTNKETRNAKEASCKEPGYTGDVHCAICDELLESGTEIPQKDHTWDDGDCTGKTCTVCGYKQESGKSHAFDDNGFCTECQAYQPAVCNADGVYEISNAGQLYWFAAFVNGKTQIAGADTEDASDDVFSNYANAILMKDIVVNQNVLDQNGDLVADTTGLRVWTPIAAASVNYYGTFDGNGKTISGLYYSASTSKIGLFGNTMPSAVVKNVTLAGSYLQGSQYVGGIVAYNKGEISGCTNTSVIRATSYVGGITGYNTNGGKITDCVNAGTVLAPKYLGGIAGYNYTKCIISNCANTGNVTCTMSATSGQDTWTGGVVAYNFKATVENCTNSGKVTNIALGKITGGVVGKNDQGTVTGCANKGSVTGYLYLGGVIGDDSAGTVKNCYNVSAINGTAYVGGVIGKGKSTAITDCYNLAKITGTGSDGQVGGVIGAIGGSSNTPLNISNCYNTGEIVGTKQVGGVAGHGEYMEMENCYNIGKITADATIAKSGQYAGGVVGYITKDVTLEDCYNTGDVTVVASSEISDSGSYVGGIVSHSSAGAGADRAYISNCYNLGTVTGTKHVGGVSGNAKNTSISDCYNAGTIQAANGNQVGGILGTAGTGMIMRKNHNVGTINCAGEAVGGILGDTTDTTLTISDCYYLADSETDEVDGTTFKTAAQFASGEVAYLLNGFKSEDNVIWKQNLGDNGDAYPTFKGAIVYFDEANELYYNKHVHDYSDEWKTNDQQHWHECACGAQQGLANHADENHDHLCDVCAKKLTDCADGNKDHKCDICDEKLSDCADDDGDGLCDICGADLNPAQSDVIRLAGDHRHDTAIKVANEMKEVLGVEKFNAIIVAYGYGYYDALAGSYLSAAKGAPILLSVGGEKYAYLDTDNIAYIKENLAEGGTVYLLGGEDAVPTVYEDGLKTFCTVTRLGGDNRFETNLMILDEVGVPAGSEILVCTATNFADCLSAAATGKPILLVWNERGSLYGNQAEFLNSLDNCTFTIIGGEEAVSNKFEGILESYGEVDRVEGGNRLGTSVAVAERYFEAPTEAVLAYGWEFPDGLCGGALAYAMKAPLLLTHNAFAGITADYTGENGITSGYVLGGEENVADNAVREIFTMAEDATITNK